MVMAEVMSQRQAFGKETPAHLCGCLAHLPIEARRPLDHDDPKIRSFATKKQGGCRAGKRSAHHCDIVTLLHSLLNRQRNESWQPVVQDLSAGSTKMFERSVAIRQILENLRAWL